MFVAIFLPFFGFISTWFCFDSRVSMYLCSYVSCNLIHLGIFWYELQKVGIVQFSFRNLRQSVRMGCY